MKPELMRSETQFGGEAARSITIHYNGPLAVVLRSKGTRA
jgi:hypothetical protein